MRGVASVVIVLALVFATTDAALEFPAVRLFQLDALSTTAFTKKGAAEVVAKLGAQRSSFEGAALAWLDAQSLAATSNATLARRVILVDALHIAEPPLDIAELARTANARNAAGVLFLVPRTGFPTAAAELAWRNTERALLTVQLNGAAFLAWREDVPPAVLQGAASGLTLAVAATKQPAAVDANAQTNVVAVLPGREDPTAAAAGLALPVVAVVAHVDTFAAFPGAAVGAAASGSCVAALLELLRMFSRLHHASPTARPRYNVVFLLASGAPANFAGLAAWLDAQPAETLLEFVLCLDTLAGGGSDNEQLYLHVSKPPKDAAVRRIYDAFTASTKVTVVHKKVNVAESEAVWPHEVLAIRRVLGATLSRLPAPPQGPLLARTSILDRHVPNTTALAAATSVIAESLARLLFPEAAETSAPVFSGKLAPDRTFLEEWAQLLATQARPFPAAAAPKSQVIAALHRAFAATGAETSESTWTHHASARADTSAAKTGKAGVAGDEGDEPEKLHAVAFAEPETRPRFYPTEQPVTIAAHRRAPALWDLYVALGVAATLFALHAALVGPARARQQIAGLFSRTKQAKKKN